MYSILKRKETGVLTLSGEGAEKSIYIQDGTPVFASSNVLDDRLGQIFLRTGLVSIRDLLQTVDESLHQKKRLGTIMVEKGLIQPRDLVQGVLTQVRDIIGSLFLWAGGRYQYSQGPLPSEELITLKLNAGEIILEGVRRIESWERIWEAVGDLEATYLIVKGSEDRVRELKLTDGEKKILAMCAQPISLGQLCDESSEKDFEICRLLWALRTLGIVKRA
jgi:hypothetical protein